MLSSDILRERLNIFWKFCYRGRSQGRAPRGASVASTLGVRVVSVLL